MGRHPLRFGIASYAWRFDAAPFGQIAKYDIDSSRDYPVLISEEPTADDPWTSAHEIGTARVGGTPGDFWVEFATDERNPRFYSVWRVDADAVANLTRILMATGQYNAR